MKLNKDTRSLVKVGTVLNDGSWDAEVLSITQSGRHGRGLSVTIRNLTGNLKGWIAYGVPMSELYGCEIKEA